MKKSNPDLFHQESLEITSSTTPKIVESIDLSPGDKIILGTQNIFAAILDLFKTTSTNKCIENKKIYITFFSDVYFALTTEELLNKYRNSLQYLLAHDWEIHFLLRLDHNVNRIIDFLCFIKPLFRSPGIYFHYINSYDTLVAGKDYVIIPGLGAISCFFYHSANNSAFYLKNPVAVTLYKNYLENLMQNVAKPLLTFYPQYQGNIYLDSFTNVEDGIGERFLYKEYFSVLILPKDLYYKLLLKRKMPTSEIKKAMDFYQQRLNSFYKNLHLYEHKDIYKYTSITDLVKSQQIYIYDHTGISLVHLEKEDVIAILENTIHHLTTYEKYHISIIKNNPFNPKQEDHIYCLAKERQGVIIEIYKPPQTSSIIRLLIKEPMVVTAILEYFRQYWNQIAPVMKEKKEVITWLQNEVSLLKSTLIGQH